MTLNDVGHVMVLGLITLLRVAVLIALSSLIWVPLGVLIGLRPTLAGKIQPIAQFLAAFPANLLFPVFVITIVHFRLNPDIWLSPLIVLGTVVHSVQRGGRRHGVAQRLSRGRRQFSHSRLAMVAPVMLPGIFPITSPAPSPRPAALERQHRGRVRAMGKHR